MEENTNTPIPEVPQPEEKPESTPEAAETVSETPAAKMPEVISKAMPDAPKEQGEEKVDGEKEKKELTPEEKKAKRKAMLKRLGIVGGVAYGVILLLTIAWAFLGAGKNIGVFDYIPFLTQEGLGNFLFTLFNVMWGLLVLAGMGVGLFGLFKMLMAKKEEEDKKKKGKKIAMIGGGAFLGLVILWIVALAFLGPRLVSEVKSGIVTDPSNTLGLTAPVEIVFDATYVPLDDSYQILSYTWNFGDGDTANGVMVSHRYTEKGGADGRYTVTLNIDYQDASGNQGDVEFTTEVSIDNEQVSAYFTATPDSGEIPLTVEFDASESIDPDGEIIAYEWDFDGDGRYDDAEGEQVEYEFTQEGSFEVSLRVTDNNGEYNIASETIEAGSVNGLRAVIETDAKNDIYYVGEKYEFDGEESTVEEGTITKYTWDFGDGESTQSRSATHAYDEPGTYEVVLTVEDSEGNKDESTLEVMVVEEGAAPTAVIETNVDAGAVPLEVEFDGTSSEDPDDDIVQYEWDFDSDGNLDDTGDTVTYTYTEVGTYEATLTVTDSAGNSDEETIEIEVVEQGITAELEVDTTNGEVPLTVEFDASGSTYKGGNIVSYEYDFGDGTTYVSGSGISYKYESVGTFTASVTVVGDDGSSDTEEIQIVVRPVAITACFTVNSDSGSAPLFLSVDPSCSEGTISSYTWDFGDGELSFDRKPDTHVYSEAGSYTVTLEVTSDEGIVDSFENTITVK